MDNQQNTSPVPPKADDVQTSVDFFDALRAILEGKRITKLEWADQNIYGLLTDGKVKIKLADSLKDWIISDGDLTGTDWVILE